MDDSYEDFSCSICLEEYEDYGDDLPRILPCSHSMCTRCLKKMLKKREYVECPQCRKDHKARKGVKSFPQNKYILQNISLTGMKTMTEAVLGQEIQNRKNLEMKMKHELEKVNSEKEQDSDRFLEEKSKLLKQNLEQTRKLQKSLEENKKLVNQNKQEKVKFEKLLQEEKAKFDSHNKQKHANFDKLLQEERAKFEKTRKEDREQFGQQLREERQKHEEYVIQSKPKFYSCPEHDREVSMFCQSFGCEKSICSVCFLNDHKEHEVVDTLQDQLEKSRDIFATLEPLVDNLKRVKKGLLSTKSDIDTKHGDCKKELLNKRDGFVKIIEESFKELIAECKDHFSDTQNEIAEEVDDATDKLNKLQQIQKNTSADNSRAELIARMLELNELKPVIERTTSKSRMYSYPTHQCAKLPGGGLKALCGNLERVDAPVEISGQK